LHRQQPARQRFTDIGQDGAKYACRIQKSALQGLRHSACLSRQKRGWRLMSRIPVCSRHTASGRVRCTRR